MTVPTPPIPDTRTTRVTALNAAARIHQGTHTTVSQVLDTADALAHWIRDGNRPVTAVHVNLGKCTSEDIATAVRRSAGGIVLPDPTVTHGTRSRRERWWRW